MNKAEILKKLDSDEHYYGEFGQQYLSNSDIKDLLDNPLMFKKNKDKTVPMLVGGYFHTLVLEPEKLKSFKVIEASTRNTKVYKEISEGELCLLFKLRVQTVRVVWLAAQIRAGERGAVNREVNTRLTQWADDFMLDFGECVLFAGNRPFMIIPR